MDRRTFAGLRSQLGAWTAVCLMFGTTGCWHLDEVAPSRRQEQAKRLPKAATCVAYGDLRATVANDAQCSGVEQEMVRDEARRAYQQAIKLEPDNMQAYVGLGRLYQAMEKYDNAVETYQKGIENLPREKSLWFELGMCQARHKDWDAALESLRMAAQLDPENPMYNNTLGFCLARAGRYDECLAQFTRTQGQAKAHFNLARMLQHLNRMDECKQHLRLAVQADPNLTVAQEMLVSLDGGRRQAAPPQATASTGSKATLSFDEVDDAALLLE